MTTETPLLTAMERKVLKAAIKDGRSGGIENTVKLKMGMEFLTLTQYSLVEKHCANWSEHPDYDDGRVGEVTNVLQPGVIRATALGREALKANGWWRKAGKVVISGFPGTLKEVVMVVLGAAVTVWITQCLSS